MVVKKFGRNIPEFKVANDEENRICQIKAASEEDFELWARETAFSKKTDKERAALRIFGDKCWIVAREKYIGVQIGCVVTDEKFIERMSKIFTILGSSRE